MKSEISSSSTQDQHLPPAQKQILEIEKFIQPPLKTARLMLEPITEDHASELFDLFSDKELHTFVPMEPPTLEQQTEKCARWSKRRSPDGTELWLNPKSEIKVSVTDLISKNRRKILIHTQRSWAGGPRMPFFGIPSLS